MSVLYPVEVSIALDANPLADPSTWTWTDISQYVILRDGPVDIGRGRADEQSQTSPSVCKVLVKNENGRFSPRNPTGPYYGRFGPNTPLRVRIDPGTGFVTRIVGFVAEWPPRWIGPQMGQSVPLWASGHMRRLGQGATPLGSALYRELRGVGAVAYWPLEDGPNATEAASGLSSGAPMSLTGSIAFASYSDIDGSRPLPDFSGGGQLAASIRGNSATQWAIEFSAKFSDGFYVPVGWTTSGTLNGVWHFLVLSATAIQVLAYDASSTQFVALSISGQDFTIAPHNWCITAIQNGADIDFQLYMDSALVDTGTLTTQTLGRIRNFYVNPNFNTPTFAVGHCVIYNDAGVTGHYEAFTGNTGEVSGTRFQRLCVEEGLLETIDVAAGSTDSMGPQTDQTLLALLRECEAAEEGLVIERITGQLGFDPHSVRENQSVALALDYALGHLADPPEPTDDDQRIRNDVTVTRQSGSSARIVDLTGPRGVTAVGRYDEGVTLNLFTDAQPLRHASWRLNLGTVDELRYPRLSLNLTGKPALIPSWLTCDVGSRVRITNLPEDVLPTADLVIEGYVEMFDGYEWRVELNCAPYKPYGVAELASTSGDTDEFLGRLIPESMELLIARDASQTSWTVATNPKFTVDSDDYPLDLRVAGEKVTATAAAAVAASFVAAGTAAHADNTSVTPGLPAGVQAGDLLLILAASRSTTSNPGTPTGYTELCNVTNVRLYGKIHSGSESAPMVTFFGTAGGDTCSAQMAAFRGHGMDVLFSEILFNGSAQDIAVPPLAAYAIVDDLDNPVDFALLLYIGWKQDDWTSVAPMAAFTEIGESSSILGNDQGITWAYRLLTDPTTASGPFVVTGGAAAISRSAIVVLRSHVVTLTVTRSVNGVVKSQALAASLEIDEPRVIAL